MKLVERRVAMLHRNYAGTDISSLIMPRGVLGQFYFIIYVDPVTLVGPQSQSDEFN